MLSSYERAFNDRERASIAERIEHSRRVIKDEWLSELLALAIVLAVFGALCVVIWRRGDHGFSLAMGAIAILYAAVRVVRCMRSLTDDRAAERRARALLDGGRARVVRCEASEVAVIGDDEPLYVFQVEPDRLFLVDGDELDDVDERFPCDDFEIATLVDATGAHDGTVVTSRGRRLRPTRKYSDAVREHFAERDDRSVVPGRVDQIELLPSRAD